ncbi:hypothetical protein LTR08_002444 [Meristemomyces frigidus]|nr:hypothetical protein LTR08_002444 [Meristemomyces frigidus]
MPLRRLMRRTMMRGTPAMFVFHFTSRISSAKMRKYKMATERGMNNGPGQRPSSNTPMPEPVVTLTPQVKPQVKPAGRLNWSAPPPTPEEAPAKKPKLKRVAARAARTSGRVPLHEDDTLPLNGFGGSHDTGHGYLGYGLTTTSSHAVAQFDQAVQTLTG